MPCSMSLDSSANESLRENYSLRTSSSTQYSPPETWSKGLILVQVYRTLAEAAREAVRSIFSGFYGLRYIEMANWSLTK